ncbi:hypothetical protein F4859DRAFT_510893 [Xylaria cf. heliscus]|nr:hypothetical protein F4859DRAFT_510893 [Xylaria cf. heliscus]
MYPKVLVSLIIMVVVLAAPLPAVGEIGIATPADHNPGYINILSLSGLVPASLTSQLKAAFSGRHYMTPNNRSQRDLDAHNDMSTALIIVWEIVLIVMIMCIALCICIFCHRQRQHRQQNAERRRAEQLPNSHPEPVDVELGAIHASSALTSNTQMEVPAPNTPDNSAQISHSNASNAEGRDTTEAAIPKIHVTDTETVQASNPEASNSALDPPTYSSALHRPETEVTADNTTESSGPEDRVILNHI